MKNKILLSLILIIIAIVTLCGINALAATEGIYTYSVSDGQATITDCSSLASGEIIIPATLGGYPVTSIGRSAFESCDYLTSIIIPDSVTSIGTVAFCYCDGLISITIPDSVTSIGARAFGYCDNLTSITIPDGVTSLENEVFCNCTSLKSVTIGNGVKSIVDQAFYNCTSLTSITIPDSVTNIGNRAFGGCTGLTSITIPGSVTNIGNSAFEDCTGLTSVIISDGVASTGSYAFENCTSLASVTIPGSLKLIGYYAFYECKSLKTIYYNGNDNEYNYDEIIISNGNTYFENAEKIALYNINAEGLSNYITVAYNKSFVIEPQTKSEHIFMGYFTEQNGKGTQITNEKGESLNVYNTAGDLYVYPYFVRINEIELRGTETATRGDKIYSKTIFATDKDAIYLTATVKYPKFLNYVKMRGVDFEDASIETENTTGEFKYLDIVCMYKFVGGFMPLNTYLIPFEIEFEVDKGAPVGNTEIVIENVKMIGNEHFDITDTENHTLEIKPKLAESIEIMGDAEIDGAAQFTASFSPDYTTDKSVEWAVDDDAVASISQDGILTPIKNGVVTITAAAKDGSGVFATKTVNIIAYAKIDNLDFGEGISSAEFNPDLRKYTVYVSEKTSTITLTPTYKSVGVLRPNGDGIWLSGKGKAFQLDESGSTIITLNRENVADMTNSVYTVEVINLDFVKTIENGNKFNITINPLLTGKRLIIALYSNGQLAEMKLETIKSDKVEFTTNKSYTNAKVMVWDNLLNLNPVFVETVK